MNSSRQARCPRCGYDLRGTVSAWRDACPLAGTCTECGLWFEWSELLNPGLYPPQWCVEYARGPWRFLGRAVRTLALTAWPFGFWRSLKMVHDVRPRRLAAYCLLLVVVHYVAFCAGHAAVVYGRFSAAARWGWMGGGPPGPAPEWPEYLRIGLLPFSDVRIGGSASSSRDVVVDVWGVWAYVLLILLIGHAACGAGFAALPISRRIAKVRWIHVHRITMYGLALLAPTVLLAMVGLALDAQPRELPLILGRAILGLAFLAAVGYVPAQIVWWSTATGRYLRMPHAWGVGLAVVVMGWLATALALTLFFLVVT
jgi:hypothetical protein